MIIKIVFNFYVSQTVRHVKYTSIYNIVISISSEKGKFKVFDRNVNKISFVCALLRFI